MSFRHKGHSPLGTRAGVQHRNKIHNISTIVSRDRKSSLHSQEHSLHSEKSSGSSHAVNHKNLSQIQCNAFKDNGWKLSQFCQLNTQSVKNKTHSIKDYIIEKDIQLLAITETWLKPDNDVKIGEITPEGYKLDPLHHMHNKAGGIAVIHHLDLKAKVTEKGQFSSYDFMDIHIPLWSDSVRLIVIYHPPYNHKTNPIPDSTFLLEFSTHMERVVTFADYLVVIVDFNIHVNLLDIPTESLSDSAKRYKAIAENFMDILDSMRLQQHTVGPTHRNGNTLDLVITRDTDHVLHGKPWTL